MAQTDATEETATFTAATLARCSISAAGVRKGDVVRQSAPRPKRPGVRLARSPSNRRR
jgi:hypothetical protein